MELVKDYISDKSFWEVNPQLTLLGPFKRLYKKDRTKNKRKSSDTAWAVFLFAESSERSLFWRLSEEDRKEALKEEFEVDFNDKLTKECIQYYQEECLSEIEKRLKQYEDFLLKRTDFLTSQEFSLEDAQEIDQMASRTKKIWDDYLKIKKEFEIEKKKSHVQGGRDLSAQEQGLLD